MKAVGLVTEYNPFHNGHIYHIEAAKAATGADVVVAVMSGNFVQRGEPALMDKWHRAQLALSHGVDLVIELPTFFAVQPSHLFADGAIQLLTALNVKQVVFGSEHADVDFYLWHNRHQTLIKMINLSNIIKRSQAYTHNNFQTKLV